MLRRDRGQSTLEYAVIIAVVAAALVAINIYMKRGIQGKLRESTDQIGEQFDAANTKFGDTGIERTRIGITVQRVVDGVTTTETGASAQDDGTVVGDEVRTEKGTETVGAW